MDLLVRTGNGAVRGTTSGGVFVFKGIPYAAPLDGPRRFQAPVAPDSWDGVRDASASSASVPQPAMVPGIPSPWQPGDSTDCLSVNVSTPDLGGGLPVMVWIHGGTYLGGTSDSPTFDGSLLASSGVVLVTVNYRVGYEGFGWVSDAPANRGVLDQLAALRWVRDNISAFGGDPDNVTIFGESSGATSVVTLVGGSARQGLFRRGIAQSVGSLFCDEDEARKLGELITGQLGVAATAEALGTLPSEAVHAAQLAVMAEMSQNRSAWTNPTPYAVVLDGEVLDDLPWAALRSGMGRGVDLISGFNADECRLWTLDLPVGVLDPAALARDLRLAASVVDDYRSGYSGIADADLYTLMLSDQLFRMPSLWCAEGHATGGGRSYAYEFTWPSPVRDGAFGACHGLDVPFTFGVAESGVGQPMFGDEVPPDFERLSSELREAWVAFAATGDPGWPAYSMADRQTRIWNVPPTVAADPIKASREIWEHHFPA
ncbi:carboxylesterase/lipase family protein [Saccharopolyspora soli]|uniref:carboxylesterase/lipase family protein n=1 Tax=Saccharopolyspora soli TaxID=2926618 RepID=UPI001F593E3F|nr:carboxylesterase family protein [Saccharopolyspora soli]